MATLFLAILQHCLQYGYVPYTDVLLSTTLHLFIEFRDWAYYLVSFMILLFIQVISRIVSPLKHPLAFLLLDYDRGPASRRGTRLSRSCTSSLILAFDVRLMVLTCYCCYPWWTHFLSSSAKWYVSLYASQDKLEDIILFPTTWFTPRATIWPPDGIVLNAILFGLLIVSQIYIIGSCIYGSFKLGFSTMLLPAMKYKCHSWTTLGLTRLHRITEYFSLYTFQHAIKSMLKSSQHATSQVFTTIYALSSNDVQPANHVSWDSDSTTAVLDNSANTHIWNSLDDFVEGTLKYFDDDDQVGVLTIDKSTVRPVGIGTVIVGITVHDGSLEKVALTDCLFFPSSPVKIISVTALASQFNDEDGTWIKTHWRRSTFTWDHAKHTIEFLHPTSKLPMLQVNLGFSKLSSFCSLFDSVNLDIQPPPLMTCQTFLPTDRYHDVCFATDDIQSAQGDPRYRFTSRDSLNMIHSVGDCVRLSKNGINQSVEIIATRVDEATQVPYFKVSLNDGHNIEVTKEFLFPVDELDIATIPISQEQVQQHIDCLDPESLEALLNPPQNTELITEFMAWHYHSGHLPIPRMFELCQRGYLPRRFLKLKDTKLICPSCIFGKAKRKPWRTKGQPGSLRSTDENDPGARVSIDHVISKQPGLVPRMDGRHTRDRITGACVFLDNHTRYSYSHLQTSIDNEQTLEAKQGFEQHSAASGVDIKAYHADNGIFATQGFRNQVQTSNQKISYCAVGAHHQNGIVERHIGILTHGARTNLLHAQRRWPAAIGSILWPFAWKDFERRYNNLFLDEDGLSPLNRFTGTTVRSDLRQFHPFGCPVFVLSAGLQSVGSSIPKWDPRARAGIYLGHSPCHAGSVALVLNPHTLRVSPQFHIVFDDEFSTVPFMQNGEIPPHWNELVRCASVLATDENFDLATSWANDFIANNPVAVNEEGTSGSSILLNGQPRISEEANQVRVSEEANQVRFSEEGVNVRQTEEGAQIRPSEEGNQSTVSRPIRPTVLGPDGQLNNSTTPESPDEDVITNELLFPTMPDLNNLTCRRSTRVRRKTQFFSLFVACAAVFTSSLVTTATYFTNPLDSLNKAVLHSQRVNTHFDGTLNSLHHAALTAAAGDNDTYTLKDVFKQDDKSEFIQAMMKEVNDHESRNHWTVLPRSAIPQGTKTILSIWSFKRKRYPDGRVLKHKARLCAHGGMQTWGENYWETYWLSVRTLMALSIIHDLETRSIDFVLAFPQAELDVDIYMELPYGFDIDGSKRYILKLNKNLYGLKNASHNFWKLLKSGLEARGYEKQSNADSCVFLGKDSIVLVYVDDCIVLHKRGSNAADRLIKSLHEGPENFDFTDDGDLDKYLGVDVKRHDDGRIELTQTHLIQRFLEVIGMDIEKVNPRATPAIKPLLFKDLEGSIRKCTWNYRQAIGMLNYLTATTRPDLAMAVHQAARFCINPMLSHERAINRIGKYLIGTASKGIIFKPDPTKGLECFVDADFAGGWNKADAIDAGTVMSRTGYVLTYAGCPLTWCSKLQSEIALSTTEAEYIALSQALREVIPLITLLNEINEIFPVHTPFTVKFGRIIMMRYH